MKKDTKPKLSIIILNYNTKDLLLNCLASLEDVKNEINFEVIVADNGSKDNSVKFVKKLYPKVFIVENGENLGFAKGNNKARPFVRGKYVLFLNSDTIVYPNTLKETVTYLESNREVGAVTCKTVLPDGSLDRDARRSFITPWIGLTHLYLKLDRFFPHSKIFAKYWYGYRSPDEIHEIDAIQGAFFMTHKKILDQVGWYDEDYFLDGEDIDLSWKIKEAGWKNVYYPKVSILHLKGATKGKNAQTMKLVPLKDRLRYRMAGVESMELFVRKRLSKKYNPFLLWLVYLGIKVMKGIRFTQTFISR